MPAGEDAQPRGRVACAGSHQPHRVSGSRDRGTPAGPGDPPPLSPTGAALPPAPSLCSEKSAGRPAGSAEGLSHGCGADGASSGRPLRLHPAFGVRAVTKGSMSMTTSRRFSILFLLLLGSLAGVPARAAGSTPVPVIEQQAADTLDHVAGVVRSADGRVPLAGAMVMVAGTGGNAVTHGDGSFRIAVPDAERYRLRIARLGYAAATVEVGQGEFAAVELEVAAIPLPDVVVTAVLSPTAANQTIRPSAVFADEKLQRQLATTLAQTVESVPGVSVTSMGPGTSQPVIRGLGGDRILALEDGQRVGDVLSSGPDHASALAPSSARRIDVIRGPSAILYGSNALGGVINVVRDEVPGRCRTARPALPRFSGRGQPAASVGAARSLSASPSTSRCASRSRSAREGICGRRSGG